jgi:ABC-type sugar transport system substrate-binding protein
VLNREVDYVAKLRQNCPAPLFALTTDQEEVGRIQGRQFAALLKEGEGILYIEGPSTDVARLRTLGMQSTKPPKVNARMLKGDWTERSGHKAVKSWLSLSTSLQLHIGVIGCQNDAMAFGARQAFAEVAESQAQKHWLSRPFTGCDGAPKTGQEWVRRGLLAATVVIPPTMGLAVEIMTKAIRSGVQPAPRTLIQPSSFPPIEEIAVRRG